MVTEDQLDDMQYWPWELTLDADDMYHGPEMDCE